MYTICEVIHPQFRELTLKSFLIDYILSCEHTFLKNCNVCVCVVAVDVLAACKRLYVGEQCSSCLAISCNIRQQNLDLTSSLYRCNSMGASIPLLDYKEWLHMQTSHSTYLCLSKNTTVSRPLCACKWGRAMQMDCVYHVLNAKGLQGDLGGDRDPWNWP